jgi:hypothetical protein
MCAETLAKLCEHIDRMKITVVQVSASVENAVCSVSLSPYMTGDDIAHVVPLVTKVWPLGAEAVDGLQRYVSEHHHSETLPDRHVIVIFCRPICDYTRERLS